MRISDWSSDVCSSDLEDAARRSPRWQRRLPAGRAPVSDPPADLQFAPQVHRLAPTVATALGDERIDRLQYALAGAAITVGMQLVRSEEHTSELQSLMRISYAVFCLKKKTNTNT